jgi:hypothetical protein
MLTDLDRILVAARYRRPVVQVLRRILVTASHVSLPWS